MMRVPAAAPRGLAASTCDVTPATTSCAAAGSHDDSAKPEKDGNASGIVKQTGNFSAARGLAPSRHDEIPAKASYAEAASQHDSAKLGKDSSDRSSGKQPVTAPGQASRAHGASGLKGKSCSAAPQAHDTRKSTAPPIHVKDTNRDYQTQRQKCSRKARLQGKQVSAKSIILISIFCMDWLSSSCQNGSGRQASAVSHDA